MRQMKRQRKNRGFSLVELIVVVLIMGIIAVSLAPQVMKWVSTAKKSSDAHIKDNLKSVGQVAVADFQAEGNTLSAASYAITSGGVKVAGGGADPNTGMLVLLDGYLGGEYPKVQNETGKIFQIEIGSGGAVTVNTVTGTY